MSRAASECITDPDPHARSAALWFLSVFCEAPGAEQVERIVEGDRSMFAGIPDPNNAKQTLEGALQWALGRRILARDGSGNLKHLRALELAKAEVLRPTGPDGLIHFIAKANEAWLVVNAEAIVRANPSAWRQLLTQLSSGAVGTAGARIADVPGVDAVTMRRFVEDVIEEPRARAQILTALANKAAPR